MHGAGNAGAGSVAADHTEGWRIVGQLQGRALMPRTQAIPRHAQAAVGGQHAREALKPARIANFHVIIQLDKIVRRACVVPSQIGGHGHTHIAFEQAQAHVRMRLGQGCQVLGRAVCAAVIHHGEGIAGRRMRKQARETQASKLQPVPGDNADMGAHVRHPARYQSGQNRRRVFPEARYYTQYPRRK